MARRACSAEVLSVEHDGNRWNAVGIIKVLLKWWYQQTANRASITKPECHIRNVRSEMNTGLGGIFSSAVGRRCFTAENNVLSSSRIVNRIQTGHTLVNFVIVYHQTDARSFCGVNAFRHGNRSGHAYVVTNAGYRAAVRSYGV